MILLARSDTWPVGVLRIGGGIRVAGSRQRKWRYVLYKVKSSININKKRIDMKPDVNASDLTSYQSNQRED